MIESDALNHVIDILRPESFYKVGHQEVYRAIFELFAESEPVDMLTVTQQLRKKGKLEMVGGPTQIMRLTSSVNSAANIEYHARIITEQAIKRELISIASEIHRDAFEDSTDVFDLLDTAEQKIFSISESNIRKNFSTMAPLVQQAIREIEARKDIKDGLTGIPTGFTALDRLTAGWQKSDLVILAARPGMGKCLDGNILVCMYDGSLKKAKHIRQGDLLMGADSRPRRVLELGRGREKMYWIRQNHGIDYRVNESHILSLRRVGNHHSCSGQLINISVGEYLQKSAAFKSQYQGYKVTVDFPAQDVPLEAYQLGRWLAKPASDNPEEAIAHFQCAKAPKALQRLGLLQRKHLPSVYQANSRAQRLSLLAGLIDASGHYCAENPAYHLDLADESLARQVKLLADTLGFRSSLTNLSTPAEFNRIFPSNSERQY
ncbi:MAG: hypothetical protein HC880_20205 [Bacteroidia bacterium]|nr:hypothetical protein [Bacteroidia bacterium]